MFEIEKIDKKGYGYEIDNPIKVFQIPGVHRYLTTLKPQKGILLNYKRVSAEYCPKTKHMVDIYFVYVLAKGENSKMLKYTLCLDMCYPSNDIEKPEDFE